MKNPTVPIILPLLAFCLNVKSDIIMSRENTRPSVYVSIQNLDSYPEVVLFGVHEGIALTKSNNYFRIKPGEKYRIPEYAPLKFYAVSKAYLDKTGISNIEWETNKNVIKSNLVIDVKKFKEKAPIVEIVMDYKIAGFDDKGIVLYRSQQKYSYNNGKPALVLPFEYKGDLTKLHQNIE